MRNAMPKQASAVNPSLEGGEEVVDVEERSWLPRHCRGDETAFTKFVNAYKGCVYSYLVRCGLNQEACDDLFQEIFIKLHRAAASYQPSRSLRPWVFTIVVNTVRNHFRNERAKRAVLNAVASPDIADSSGAPDKEVAARQLISWLEGAIAALPFAQREVLILTTIDGLQHKDVSEILEMPVNTVKTHLRRARHALASMLADGCTATPQPGETQDEL